MGANIKALRNRIKSVDSTLHLTKAMGLVASSKIRRATDNMNKARQYEQAFTNAMEALLSSPECKKSSLAIDRGGEKQALVVIAGDRGLAGGYNANVFRFMREYTGAKVIPIGKRACDRYGGGYRSAERFSLADGHELAKTLCKGFINGEYDRVGIVCTKYISMITQEVQLKWILPLNVKEKNCSGVIFEPDESAVLDNAITEYIAGCITAEVRESFASEIASRRNAMDSAGKNAQQMIDELALKYNRARQGAITQELTEIVAGSGM